MQPPTEYLLIRQISALIAATADATSPSKEYVPLTEARLYAALAAHCTERQKLAAVPAKDTSPAMDTSPAPLGMTEAVEEGVVYW